MIIGQRIRYAWHLRVPIVGLVVLVGLPIFSFSAGLKPFLGGLFDPLSERAFLLITALALFNAWTCVIVICLVLKYGSVRLDLPRLTLGLFPVSLKTWCLSSLLMLPVVGVAIYYAWRASGRAADAMLGYSGLGALVAMALLALALKINRWVDGHNVRTQERPSWLGRLYGKALRWMAKHPAFGSGFVEAGKNGECRLAPGHGLASGLAAGSIALYVATGFLTRNIQRPDWASTLTFVLLLLLMLVWLLGLLAFLFDRGRIPLVVLLGLWVLVVDFGIHRIFSTDHIYRTVEPVEASLATPMTLLGGPQPAIVVAASGGGILAAAWTSRVLTAIQRDVPEFPAAVRLISAVSGGSVGTMNVISSWPECGPPQPGQDTPERAASPPFEPNAASRESSLHAVAWGLVFKDLPRSIAPFFASPLIDRGSVLEDAWKREPRLSEVYPSPKPFLSSWRRNVAELKCPAIVLNAMAAESGEPMLFSTVQLPQSLVAFDFYTHYDKRDVPMTTAVRLSAGFPYVSPASRADADDAKGKYTHVVDGGYFDNFGISTLAAVVHSGLRALDVPAVEEPVRRLLVIEICESDACSGADAPKTPKDGGEDRGWPYQILAPLKALSAMRTSAQRATNRTALQLLKDYWSTRGACIESIEVPLVGKDAPMSWHLTGAQKRSIDDEWNKVADEKIRKVRQFLQTPAGLMKAGCPDTKKR